MTRNAIRSLVIFTPALLVGCASVNPKPAFMDVQSTIAARTGQNVEWIRDDTINQQVQQRVQELLQDALTIQTATEIALLNNRALQVTYEEIGLSQADLVQSGLLKNPSFGFSARFPDQPPSATNMEFSLVGDLVDLLLLPLKKRLAVQQLEQVKLRVADEVLALISNVQKAFYTMQAREQLLDRLGVIVEAEVAALQLAQAQYDAGNINDLDLTMQQTQFNQIRIEQEKARVEESRDRESLNRVMGLSGMAWKISPLLPEIPAEEFTQDQLETLAMAQRFDLAAMNTQVTILSTALSTGKKTRLLPTQINVGFDAERDSDKVWLKGPTVELDVPIFDRGQAKVARLDAQLRQAQRLTEVLQNQICTEVVEANTALSANRAAAEVYREGLFPQRARILGLTLQHYNFMLKGTYDLLLARQQQAETEQAYIEAWRDYWIARSELARAVGGSLPSGTPAAAVDKAISKDNDMPGPEGQDPDSKQSMPESGNHGTSHQH